RHAGRKTPPPRTPARYFLARQSAAIGRIIGARTLSKWLRSRFARCCRCSFVHAYSVACFIAFRRPACSLHECFAGSLGISSASFHCGVRAKRSLERERQRNRRRRYFARCTPVFRTTAAFAGVGASEKGTAMNLTFNPQQIEASNVDQLLSAVL